MLVQIFIEVIIMRRLIVLTLTLIISSNSFSAGVKLCVDMSTWICHISLSRHTPVYDYISQEFAHNVDQCEGSGRVCTNGLVSREYAQFVMDLDVTGSAYIAVAV